jgi:hypothetical protein
MMCIAVPCLALGLWLSHGTTPAAAFSTPFVDLSESALVEVRSLDGDVMMSGEFRSRTDFLGNVEKDAALIGTQFTRVIGEIEIDIPRPGAADPRQELEIDVISLRPMTAYQVFINDRRVATFHTDSRGGVDAELLSTPAPRAALTIAP